MSKVIRALTWLVVAICIGSYAALVYGGVTAPVLPYSSTVPYAVGRITRPADAGDLRPQDNIVEFNRHPFFTCIYTGFFTPIYNAPRNQEIPITYWRLNEPDPSEGQLSTTTIVLRSASPQDLWSRASNYLVGAVFIAVGAFFLIFRWPQLRLLVVTCMLAGLAVTSVPDSAQFVAPFGVAYWIGLPLWAAAATVALADWPLSQLRFRVPRLLVLFTACLAAISIFTNSAGYLGASCAIPSMENLVLVPFGRDLHVPTGFLFNARLVSSLAITLLPPFSLSYLLFSAYRRTTNRFIRTQVRTLAWVHAVVWIFQASLSSIPVLLGISALSIAPYFLTAITLFLPVTWAVVAFRSTVIGVESFLNRTLFALLLLVASVVIMFSASYALLAQIPNPDPILITVLAVVPILLFSTLLRKPFENAVDFVLYGHYYDYEETLALLMQDLTTASNAQSMGRVLSQNVPQALLIKSAAFWARTAEDHLALLETWNVPVADLPSQLPDSQFKNGERPNVYVHREPFELGSQNTRWQVTVKLVSGSTVEGVLLLGPKLRERSYSEKDTRVLLSLANWIGGRLAGWRLTEIQMQHEREQTLVLIEHEAEIRTQVAQELHDRGITALSLVKRLVEREQPGAVVEGALQEVINDLRVLTSSHLKPSGLDYGLMSGLQALVRDYKQLGTDITLHSSISESSSIWRMLSSIQSRELFFVAREAVTNAYKADNKVNIVIRIEGNGSSLTLSIQDKGPGFGTSEAAGNEVLHHGLSIMRARAHNINANLTIDSARGVGTTVSVSLPLRGELLRE